MFKRPLPVLFLNTGNQTVVFFMANDVSGVILEESVPCIALSKNDSYVMSACGGKVSLFNMMTFKVSHSIRLANFIRIGIINGLPSIALICR